MDTEIEVSDKFLADAKIAKGKMTLVDEARQKELLNVLNSKHYCLVKKCGGSVCNSVVAASYLGAKTFFSGKVADDSDGKVFIRELREAGVCFHSRGQDPGITGKCLVMVTQDAERTMHTFLGASESLSFKEIDKNALKNSEWFYIEGYLVTNETRAIVTKEAIDFAKRNSVKVAVSLSDPFVVEVFSDTLRAVIGNSVDLIFCNRAEALAFTKTHNVRSAAEILKRFTKTFVITDGANGSVTYDGKSIEKSKGFPEKAIDTNGAGDMFAGAFLFAITSGKSYCWAARFANYCASKVVSQFGPRLKPEQFIEIKEEFDI